jgi:hypothetical protein
MNKTSRAIIGLFFIVSIVVLFNQILKPSLQASDLTEKSNIGQSAESTGSLKSVELLEPSEPDRPSPSSLVVPSDTQTLENEKESIEGDQDMYTHTFEILQIDDQLKEIMQGKSYHDNETVSFEDLRLVTVLYYGYDENDHEGEIVVHKDIAEKVLNVFKILYDKKFPIESIKLVDYFEGDDDLSMKANNSSGFNFRVIPGTDRISNHGYGLAIDINPLVNPYVTKKGVFPSEGEAYVDRNQEVKGMIKENDVCYNAFISEGFTWGGAWQNSKDYQHFEIKIEGINQ